MSESHKYQIVEIISIKLYQIRFFLIIVHLFKGKVQFQLQDLNDVIDKAQVVVVQKLYLLIFHGLGPGILRLKQSIQHIYPMIFPSLRFLKYHIVGRVNGQETLLTKMFYRIFIISVLIIT